MVREHIKGAGKKCRAEHTGGALLGVQLDRVIVPRVVTHLKAKGTWVFVREHIKGAGKKSRAEHTGGTYWGSPASGTLPSGVPRRQGEVCSTRSPRSSGV